MSFSSEIASWSRDSLKAASRVQRGVVISLFGAVIRDTPVDTGRLRSNWRCSIGEPNRTEQDQISKGGTAAVTETLETSERLTLEDTAILTNNLPYAFRIEFEGWSKKKAPEGMVRRNVARFHTLLGRELRKNP